MKKVFSLGLAIVLLFFSACGTPKGLGGSAKRPAVKSSLEQFRQPVDGDYIATILSSEGKIEALLFAEYVPQAVENFRLLSEKEYYNDTIFHRVKKDFVIQGGDATGTGTGGESAWGAPFPVEYSSKMFHFSGALCMVSSAAPPGSVTSQFYIVATPWDNCKQEETMQNLLSASYSEEAASAYQQVGGAPYLDREDTVFGQVISGMDIVDAIAKAAVGSGGRPVNEIKILSISIAVYVAQGANLLDKDSSIAL